MKRILFYLLFLLIGKICFAQDIPARPNPPKLVNDFANVLTIDQRDALEKKLVAYDDSTSNQLVVVIVKAVGDYDVQEYALKILRDWGVGNKKNNNGAVLLASMNDHKLRIEVGYGLEGAIPDVLAKQIIEAELTPNFKEGNYYRGFDDATDAIFKAAAGEYKAPEGYDKRGQQSGGSSSMLTFIVIVIIIIILVSRSGGGSGGMMSRRGWGPIVWFPTGGGGSGWSGGGGGWSGGGGGGGFGGFGGGSGGGGGASGSW